MFERHNLSSISYRRYNHFLNEYSHQFQGNSIPIDPWSQLSLWCLPSLTESISPARVSTDGFLVWWSCWAPTRSCCTSICTKHSPWRRRKFTKKNRWTLLNTCWSFGIAILYFFLQNFGLLLPSWCMFRARWVVVQWWSSTKTKPLHKLSIGQMWSNLQPWTSRHPEQATSKEQQHVSNLIWHFYALS